MTINEEGQIVYADLNDAMTGFAESQGLKLVYDYPAARFETEDAVYCLFLCNGEESRLSVHAVKFLQSDGGFIINGDAPDFSQRYHQDIPEPIDDEIRIVEMNIDGTDMKFVCGKAFWKRYKPYLNGEYYGRLDRNSMFFYAMKQTEHVEIRFR